MSNKYRCLSLHLPWAMLCVDINPETGGAYKIHETRGRNCNVRGPVVIHAAKKWDKQLMEICCTDPFRKALSKIIGVNPEYIDPFKDTLHDYVMKLRGKLIGQVNFDYCNRVLNYPGYFNQFAVISLNNSESPGVKKISGNDYHFGNYDRKNGDRYAIGMSDPKKLAEPIAFKGSQGFFFYNSPEPLKFK